MFYHPETAMSQLNIVQQLMKFLANWVCRDYFPNVHWVTWKRKHYLHKSVFLGNYKIPSQNPCIRNPAFLDKSVFLVTRHSAVKIKSVKCCRKHGFFQKTFFLSNKRIYINDQHTHFETDMWYWFPFDVNCVTQWT